jgi:hypothetical protein
VPAAPEPGSVALAGEDNPSSGSQQREQPVAEEPPLPPPEAEGGSIVEDPPLPQPEVEGGSIVEEPPLPQPGAEGGPVVEEPLGGPSQQVAGDDAAAQPPSGVEASSAEEQIVEPEGDNAQAAADPGPAGVAGAEGTQLDPPIVEGGAVPEQATSTLPEAFGLDDGPMINAEGQPQPPSSEVLDDDPQVLHRAHVEQEAPGSEGGLGLDAGALQVELSEWPEGPGDAAAALGEGGSIDHGEATRALGDSGPALLGNGGGAAPGPGPESIGGGGGQESEALLLAEERAQHEAALAVEAKVGGCG